MEHLRGFKERMRGRIRTWDCRAGHNGELIRPDGTLSPCFDMITYDYDWGRIWKPRFHKESLQSLKEKCMPLCSSTCFHTMSHYHNLTTIPGWVRKHTLVG